MAIIFNGPSKTISLSLGTTILSVRDLYSRWVDWFLTNDNSKYLPAFNAIGGDDIDTVAGTKIPVYGFLLNNWKIQPQAANHTLNVRDGILLVFGGGDPFIEPVGSFVIRINYQQPVQAISFVSNSGGVSPQDIADAVALEISAMTLDANIKSVNNVPVSGTGVDGDEWGPQ